MPLKAPEIVHVGEKKAQKSDRASFDTKQLVNGQNYAQEKVGTVLFTNKYY